MFITIRVRSVEERNEWHAAARAAGFRSLSDFIRSRLASVAARRTRKRPGPRRAEAPQEAHDEQAAG